MAADSDGPSRERFRAFRECRGTCRSWFPSNSFKFSKSSNYVIGARVYYDLVPLKCQKKGMKQEFQLKKKYRKKIREVHSLPQIPHTLEQEERRGASGSSSSITTNFRVSLGSRNRFFRCLWTKQRIFCGLAIIFPGHVECHLPFRTCPDLLRGVEVVLRAGCSRPGRAPGTADNHIMALCRVCRVGG